MNIAKDKNGEEIPTKMFNGGIEIEEDMIPESFAEHFSNKISNLLTDIAIDANVYNGPSKMTCENMSFMTSENILRAVQSIKMNLIVNLTIYFE